MSDKPILFSAPMVRALLAGTKTQTRRLAGVPTIELNEGGRWHVHNRHGGAVCTQEATEEEAASFAEDYLPIQPGDRLWVKESHAIVPRSAYRNSDGVQQTLRPDDDHDAAVYAANWERSKPGRWRPSIHMFRWASRLTLHVTEVRVQRLHDISEADALAEGMTDATAEAIMTPDELALYASTHILCPEARGRILYQHIWDQINGTREVPEPWALNPWVAAYTFEVEHCNIAQARPA